MRFSSRRIDSISLPLVPLALVVAAPMRATGGADGASRDGRDDWPDRDVRPCGSVSSEKVGS